MKRYQRFASVYDLMGADRHSVQMVEYCFRIFRRFDIRPTVGLDLCCGTGSAIARFADQGITMSGLDQSAEMLAQAARKLKGRKIRLYQESLPRFRILKGEGSNRVGRFDLITCFYDSLNYLRNKRELKTAFRSVYAHLTPGGWFIFDMNTPPALKLLWGSQTFAGVRDDLAWVWRNSHSERTNSAHCRATFFVKKGKLWERFDEIHAERAYENETIMELLGGVSFQIRGFYRCFSFDKPTKRTYRVCGVVRRPG